MPTDDAAPPVAAYFAATNAFDREALLATFTREATIDDEGRFMSGHDAVAAWFDETVAAYRPRFRITGSEVEAGWIVVSTAVSGTFPGGEVLRVHRFLLAGTRIAALEIHA